jgi:hypothetical protein
MGIVAMKTQAGGLSRPDRALPNVLPPHSQTALLKWVLHNQSISTAIPGVTTHDQLEQNITVAFNLEYTAAEKEFSATRLGAGAVLPSAANAAPTAARRRIDPDALAHVRRAIRKPGRGAFDPGLPRNRQRAGILHVVRYMQGGVPQRREHRRQHRTSGVVPATARCLGWLRVMQEE